MGFNRAIDEIKDRIGSNEPLLAFCRARFSKGLTVTRTYKKKVELNLADFPLIMITRPTKEATRLSTGERAWINTLTLYCGLTIQSRDAAQGILVDFEELIEDALEIYETDPTTRPVGVVDVEPQESANDEGVYHPTYIIAKKIAVTAMKVPPETEEVLLTQITTIDHLTEETRVTPDTEV